MKQLQWILFFLSFFYAREIFARQESVGHFLENNSTNFHNMLFNARYHFHRYHTYLFEYWKSIDFGNFFQQMNGNPGYNKSWTDEEILQNLEHDDESNSTLAQITSMCGKLANASSPYISDQCFKDLDFMACTLFEFLRDAKKFIKGDCDRLKNANKVQQCKDDLKAKLMRNLWPMQMLDSFGKVPAGLNMGNHMSLGRFSDCNSIIVPRETHNGRAFEANYCRVTFRFPLPETAAQITRQCQGVNLVNAEVLPGNQFKSCLPHENFARMKWGICAPMSCNSRNLTVIFRMGMPPTKHFCNTTVACREKPQYDTDFKFMIGCVILAPFILLVVAGTVYDLIFVQPTLEILPDQKHDLIKVDRQSEINGQRETDIVLTNGRTKSEFLSEKSAMCRILFAFSAYTNGEKLLNTDENNWEIPTIRALRAISTIWLICIFSNVYIMSYIDNTKAIPKMIEKFSFQWINNGSFVSDSLLLLSGFLTAFVFFKLAKKQNSPFSSWGRQFLNGFLKLYVPFFLTMVFLLFIWKYFVTGPMWSIYFFNPMSPVQCYKSFWTNIILLNDFIWTSRPCFPLFQLLALSIQLKMLSYPLMALLSKWPVAGFASFGVLVTVSCVLQLVVTLVYDLPPSLIANIDPFSMHLPMANYYVMLFTKPYMRWNAFFIGILLAWVLIRKPGKLDKIVKRFSNIFWFLSLVSCVGLIFGLHGFVTEKTVGILKLVFYALFSRLIWCLALATIIYLCETENSGMIRWLFLQNFWAPMARLTYSTFIVSPFVVLYTYATSESILHLTTYNMLYFCIGCTVMSFLVAFVFHLFFEAPIWSLIQLFQKNKGFCENIEQSTDKINMTATVDLFGGKAKALNEPILLKDVKMFDKNEANQTQLQENA